MFVHLSLHTEYSISDGLVRVKDLVSTARDNGMPAIAITDNGNLFAIVKFYRAALAQGIKPIIGVELRLAASDTCSSQSSFILLCASDAGYRNLTQLVTRAYLEGQQSGRPQVRKKWLEQSSEGLIAISGGISGELGKALIDNKNDQAKKLLRWWMEVFKDAFYIELQRTGKLHEEEYIDKALQLAHEFKCPVVATNNVRFLRREEYEAHEIRVCINQGRVFNDSRRTHEFTDQQYLRTQEEMQSLFHDIPEALENTVEIAKRCNLILSLGENVLPEFPLPENVTTDQYLRTEAVAGLDTRLGPLDVTQRTVYQARLESELEVIERMGYAGYFLIVSDFTRWARSNDVPVGPGRGSGAGSLVAYALSITDVDPLKYNLLFERFLNPERISMPDFDIDFCMEGRDRVIDYVAGRYGRDKVSQIITYGSMAAKAVVRDVGRVLAHPYGFVDRIAKMIPFEIGMTLSKALEREEDLQQAYENEEEVRAILDMAMQLEGLARNPGKHAGGVVISPTALTDFTPLYCEPGGKNIVTQLDKDDVEAIGLVKFDFLGLRTLTIIDRTVKQVNAARNLNHETPLDLGLIPLDDQKTFQLLQRCETTAVFQLESDGLKDILKRLQPDKFDDIVALVALYRPGPLQSGMVDDFINRKHGARVEYPHPALEELLKETYGVILYQEQVMQIAQVLAGYTLGGADLLRRAMGKKKPEEMAKQREVFTQGAVERGVAPHTATYIFDLMEKFAGYGFNKSHSVAYAVLAYQTAWLKAHYPAYFMSAVLSSDMDNTDKVVNLIDECRTMGLSVQAPNINASMYQFTVGNEQEIIYGLGAIKGVGAAAVEHLIVERERGGPFKSLHDLCLRIDLQRFNRRSLEAMVRCGALDSFGNHRATLMHYLPQAMQLAEQQNRNTTAGQNDLFGGSQIVPTGRKLQELDEWDSDIKLLGERETIGLFLTGHPVTQYQQELAMIAGKTIRERLSQSNSISSAGNNYAMNRNNLVKVAGLLYEMRLRNSPAGKFAFLTLDDNTARIDVAVFADEYHRFSNLLIKDTILIVEGALTTDDYTGRVRIRAKDIMTLDAARSKFGTGLAVSIEAGSLPGGLVADLRNILRPYASERGCPVVIRYHHDHAVASFRLGDQWRVHLQQELLKRLAALNGVKRTEVYYR